MWFRIWLILFSPASLLSQQLLEGLIRDGTTKVPVAFCAVGIKNKNTGTLANEDGKFLISADRSDTIIFQHPGYQKIFISFAELALNTDVYLKQTSVALTEVPVYATDEWLYELVNASREKLLNPQHKKSKAYFTLQSSIGGQPVELLECYYNSDHTPAKVSELKFKNGRAGAARYGERYFMNLNSSKVFTSIDLLTGHKDMPVGPFELNKRKLHRTYSLKLIDISDDQEPVFHLAFKPKINNGEFFGGELWIEKGTYNIKKIKMNVGHTQTHPFLPMFPNGKVKSVSMQVTKVFSDNNLPEHLDFNYTIRYEHRKSSTVALTNNDTIFDVDCKGLLYFYDYNDPFILPFFQYDETLDDYRKITLLTYNDAFWQINKGSSYSYSMIEALKYFRKNGELINYQSKGRTRDPRRNTLFENNFLLWSGKSRLSLKSDRNLFDSTRQIGFANELHNIDKYNLKAQIFLDVNKTMDSLQHHSETVLDTYHTFYNLKEDKFTNCFFNIYFDIFEISRRNLEMKLSKNKLSATEAIFYYKEASRQAESSAEDFIAEVNRGKNFTAMEKWNEYIFMNLGIDNMKLFGLRLDQTSKGPEPSVIGISPD